MSDDEDDVTDDELESDDIIIDESDYDHHPVLRRVYITGSDRTTSNFMTEFEIANVIRIWVKCGERNIFNSEDYTDDKGRKITDPTAIAYKMLKEKKIPLIILRPIKQEDDIKYYDYWKVSDLILPDISL